MVAMVAMVANRPLSGNNPRLFSNNPALLRNNPALIFNKAGLLLLKIFKVLKVLRVIRVFKVGQKPRFSRRRRFIFSEKPPCSTKSFSRRSSCLKSR